MRPANLSESDKTGHSGALLAASSVLPCLSPVTCVGGVGFSPMPLSFGCHSNSAQIVGQPILAAAGFQPALPGHEVAHGRKEPPKRRLRARLPAPQFLPDSQPRENQVALGFSLPIRAKLGLLFLRVCVESHAPTPATLAPSPCDSLRN